jgi:2-phospho-L-lactate transferase/gluconeogenesis factor (CofD/UPF0052 family)
MVPPLAEALIETDAHLVVVLNLAPQEGETEGFGPADHLRVLVDHAPELELGTVLVDRSEVEDAGELVELEALAGKCGARVVVADVSHDDGTAHHDPAKLSAAYAAILADL